MSLSARGALCGKLERQGVEDDHLGRNPRGDGGPKDRTPDHDVRHGYTFQPTARAGDSTPRPNRAKAPCRFQLPMPLPNYSDYD
jgi:hypothetical protein